MGGTLGCGTTDGRWIEGIIGGFCMEKKDLLVQLGVFISRLHSGLEFWLGGRPLLGRFGFYNVRRFLLAKKDIRSIECDCPVG